MAAVESTPLGDICKIETGKLDANAAAHNGEYAFFTTAQAISRIDCYRWDTEALLIAGNANVGDVKHYKGKFEAYQRTYVLTEFCESIEVRYLYYVLCNGLKQYLETRSNKAAMTYIVLGTLKMFPVPIPPLQVQREIVRMLDKFTELTGLATELTAELTARQKQYAHYRDQLLTFIDDMPIVSLGDVCQKSSNIRWKETNKDYHYIDLTSVSRETNEIKPESVINAENAPSRAQQIVRADDVLFATTRPTLKRYCYVPTEYDGHICSTGFCVLRADRQLVTPRFLFYVITTSDFDKYVEDNQEGTSYPAISNTKVKKYRFRLPPIAQQQHIITILDRFNTLTTDISTGLPAEIAARQKQYEYYRNKLLTFNHS